MHPVLVVYGSIETGLKSGDTPLERHCYCETSFLCCTAFSQGVIILAHIQSCRRMRTQHSIIVIATRKKTLNAILQ